MPYARKFKKRRFKKRRGRSSAGKKLLRDARKKGVNSAAELAVRLIAKKTAQSLMAPNLIFRRTILGTYDRPTNVFGIGTPIDMDGVCIHQFQCPVWDIQTLAAQQPLSDPSLEPNIPNYNRGTNVLAAGEDQDGYRNSSKTTVFNMGVDLRIVLDRIPLQQAVRREDVTIRYALIAVSSPDAYQLGWQPAVNDAMPFKGLGYSSRLDDEVVDAINDTRRKTLAQGKITLRYSPDFQAERFRHLFWTGKMPYEFKPNDASGTMDQNGQQVVSKWKVFCVIRSDVAVIDPLFTKPRVNGFIKVGYRNVA